MQPICAIYRKLIQSNQLKRFLWIFLSAISRNSSKSLGKILVNSKDTSMEIALHRKIWKPVNLDHVRLTLTLDSCFFFYYVVQRKGRCFWLTYNSNNINILNKYLYVYINNIALLSVINFNIIKLKQLNVVWELSGIIPERRKVSHFIAGNTIKLCNLKARRFNDDINYAKFNVNYWRTFVAFHCHNL